MAPNSVLNVKGVVAAFNQEKALVGAFSVIMNLRMDLFQALLQLLLLPRVWSVVVAGQQQELFQSGV